MPAAAPMDRTKPARNWSMGRRVIPTKTGMDLPVMSSETMYETSSRKKCAGTDMGVRKSTGSPFIRAGSLDEKENTSAFYH